ncbi:MAG TPA: glutamyl-tRNA reductase, partial [Thermodesulfobacteriota bacterium]|nr:glutamyl-tRNA reductase [Thermodesulfobacteriota bacterium]
MSLVLVGLNHTTAPVALRERLAVAAERLPALLPRLARAASAREACLLSTCNRVELLADAPGLPEAEAAAAALAEWQGVEPAQIRPVLYRLEGGAAARHLFRVAAGLDSLVLGEPQILGQVKAAYAAASQAGTTGPLLNRLFHTTFRVAKRIRSETGLGAQPVSVGQAAVELARRIFDDLARKRVLLVGAGEMAEATARHLVGCGVQALCVANRTFERAQGLAAMLGGRAVPFDGLLDAIRDADIVIASAAAEAPLLDAARVAELMRARRQAPLFFIDIAVPRNVDPRVHELPNVYLYNIDDLQAVVAEGLRHRQREAVRAEAIVQEEVEGYLRALDSRAVVPTLVALRRRFEAVRRAELARAAALLRELTPEQRAAVERLTEGLLAKLLHEPTVALKRAAADAEGPLYAEVLRTLFDLRAPAGEPA